MVGSADGGSRVNHQPGQRCKPSARSVPGCRITRRFSGHRAPPLRPVPAPASTWPCAAAGASCVAERPSVTRRLASLPTMRTVVALSLFVIATSAVAQTNDPACSYDECALRSEPAARVLGLPSLVTRVVRVSADTTVAGGFRASFVPDRALTPTVASSPEAVRYAQTYDRLQATRYVVGLAGSALLVAYVVDNLGAHYLGRDAEIALLGGSVAMLSVGIPLGLRSRRAARQTVEAYNASLGR